MSVKLEAFLSLESSLSSRVTAAWDKVSTDALPMIYARLKQNDVLGATRLVDNLDLSPIMRQCRDYVKYVSFASILFGASRVAEPVAESKVMEQRKLSPLVNRTLASFAAAITNTVGEQIKAKLYGLIKDHDLSQPATNFTQSEGNVLFKAENTTLLKPFVEFRNPVNDEAQRLIQIISGLHTSRLAAFGYTEEAQLRGVTQYMINEQLDNKICPVCEVMHGQTFEVDQARGLLERVLMTDDPTELTVLQPWPAQNKVAVQQLRDMDPEEIIMNGWHIPPYHPYCRGQLVRVGEMPRIEETPSYQAAFPSDALGDFSPEVIDAETFNTLGIEVTDDQAEAWNKEVDASPAELLSAMTGMTPQEMADEAYDPVSDTTDSSRFGVDMEVLANASEEERLKILVNLKGLYLGLKEKIDAALEYIFSPAENVLHVNSLNHVGEKSLPDVMLAWVAAAKLAGIDRMELEAELDPTGGMWSDYGGMPDDQEWEDVRSGLKEAILTNDIDLSKGQQEEVLQVLDNTDTEGFWELVDLDIEAVDEFLANMGLTVYVDLNDTVSMQRLEGKVGH